MGFKMGIVGFPMSGIHAFQRLTRNRRCAGRELSVLHD